MHIFSLLSLLLGATGLWMLLRGMQVMKTGLETAARDKLQRALETMAGSPVRACLTGMIATLLVQSSTAVSVLSVGFVNAGIMKLPQAIGILLGANVGTCATVQVISFDLTRIALLGGAAGVLFYLWGKNPAIKNLGRALTGFGAIFTGLKLLSLSFAPLKNATWFIEMLRALSGNPFLAMIAGTIASALLHSSAAATGIVMLLSGRELLPLTTAIAIVMGNNVGTCITAVLASLAGPVAGKRVAAAHVVLNVAGVILFFPFLSLFAQLVALTSDSLSRQVANAHTIFNIACSAAVLPFTGPFARLVETIVPGRG